MVPKPQRLRVVAGRVHTVAGDSHCRAVVWLAAGIEQAAVPPPAGIEEKRMTVVYGSNYATM